MQVLKSAGSISVRCPGTLHILGAFPSVTGNFAGYYYKTKSCIETVLTKGLKPGQIDLLSKHQRTLYYYDVNQMQLGRFKNPYVQAALTTSLQAVKTLKPDLDLSGTSLKLEVSSPKVFYTGMMKITGIGSSNALVCSIVSSILHHFDITDLATIRLICQFAHAKGAGGKYIGNETLCPILGSTKHYIYNPSNYEALALEPQLTREQILTMLGEFDWTAFEPFSFPENHKVSIFRVNSPTVDADTLMSRIIKWNLAYIPRADELYHRLRLIMHKLHKALANEDMYFSKGMFIEYVLHLHRIAMACGHEMISADVKEAVIDLNNLKVPIYAGMLGVVDTGLVYTVTADSHHHEAMEMIRQEMPKLELLGDGIA
mmetsp:Transcript_2068/g.4749  ORF Transcript_2068/g.4749 Transcript_2068/m.4749 type:complete len:372 (-) Transcript_2068:4380-5495(-)